MGEPLEGHVIVVSADHIEIDIGDHGIRGEDIGVIKRDGVEIGLASVVWVDVNHTNLRVLSVHPNAKVEVGDLVVFESKKRQFENTMPPPPPSPPSPPEPSGPLTAGATEQFVPLLAPVNMPKTAIATSSNLFHGRVRGFQLYQVIKPNQAWYSISRLDLDGSIERLYGQPWSFVWSGNTSYRNGSTFSTSDDFKHPRPHFYKLELTRKLDEAGFINMGRFFPAELPGLGYVDGGHVELPTSDTVRFGGIAGLRPDRVNLGFTGKEPIASGYGTLEEGTPRHLFYTGTLGIFRTWYHGLPDELALLYDQRADLGSKVNLIGSAQVDFNTGAALVKKQSSLSRGDLTLNAPLALLFDFRAGVNHFEPVDIAAERDLASGTTFYLNNGYTRYWAGVTQFLPWAFWLSEDISFTNTQGKTQQGLWRFGITRGGLPGMPNAFITVTTYNLYNVLGPEYGSTVSGSLPFLDGKFSTNISAGFTYGPGTSTPDKRFRTSDINANINWLMTTSWILDIGGSRSYSDQIQSTSVNAGLTYRW